VKPQEISFAEADERCKRDPNAIIQPTMFCTATTVNTYRRFPEIAPSGAIKATSNYTVGLDFCKDLLNNQTYTVEEANGKKAASILPQTCAPSGNSASTLSMSVGLGVIALLSLVL
jgi:hypothetical protein